MKHYHRGAISIGLLGLSVLIRVLFWGNLFAQSASLLDYDSCKSEVSKSSIKQYEKAFKLFKNRKYAECTKILKSITEKESDFASPYFLLGMIGIRLKNDKMIEEYFPLCKESCEDFSHPYLYYYLGLIDYTYENYKSASQNFEHFLSLSEGNNFYDSLQNVAINYIDWSNFLHSTMESRVEFIPQNIDFLAKNRNYYEPFITANEKEIYFIREEITRDTNISDIFGSVHTSVNRYSEWSRKDSTGFYDKGFVLGEPFNLDEKEGGVSITADGNYLFFSKKMNTKDNKTWDIYYCERIDDYYSMAQPLLLNTDIYDEFSPSISADGNRLYFVSNRKGGKGGYDIWYVNRTGKTTWSEPANMNRNVNTFLDELYPFISADDVHLYFLSNGRKTIGGKDIFVYNISEDKPAKNIGYGVNTEGDEHSMGVLLDGKRAYTTYKGKDEKYSHIVTFNLSDSAKSFPRNLAYAKLNSSIDDDFIVNLINLENGENHQYFVANEHRDFVFVTENDTKYLVTFDKLGYMLFAKVLDGADTFEVKVEPLINGAVMPLYNIEFAKEAKGFTPISNEILDTFVLFLNTNKAQRIILHGKQKMISAIEDYFLKSGVRQDRVFLSPNNSDEILYEIK